MKSLFALFLQATQVLAVSQIAIFSDEHCQNSLRGLEGPNGYPNGTCTDLRRNGPYGSFQVVGLDPGCTVTIYAKDTTEDICSGYAEEIRPVECHNNTFVYYSIDFCDVNPVNEQPPSSRSSSTPKPEAASSALSPGAIAGAVVGGVAGLAIIVGLIAFFVLKKRKQAQNNSPEVAEYVATAPAEVHGKHLHEMGAVAYKQTAVEVEQPPAELEGTEMRADEQSRPFN